MEVGRLGRTFGVEGWLRFYTSLDFSLHEFSKIKSLFFKESAAAPLEEMELCSVRRGKDAWLVKLAGVDTPELAQRVVGREVFLPRNELPKLRSGEFYWSDLKGLTVINQKSLVLGKITEIIATGANDVLVVEGERRRLIPYISQVIVKIDLNTAQMVVAWEEDF